MKLSRENIEIVAGAICATARQHSFPTNLETIEGIWCETANHDTYGNGDKLWVKTIRSWQDGGEDLSWKAWVRVRNLVLRKWKQRADLENQIATTERILHPKKTKIKLSNGFFLEASVTFPNKFYYYKPGILNNLIDWKTIDNHIALGAGAIWTEILAAANMLESSN